MCEGPHPYIPIPNTAMIEWRFTTPGGQALNRFFIEKPDAWTLEDLTDAAEAAEDLWESELSGLVSTGVSLNETVVTDMTTESGGQVVNPGGISGGNANPVMPSNVTVAISFRTALRGRSFRGRLYHVGLTDLQVTGDTLVEGFDTTLATAYQDIMQGIGAAVTDGQHVVVSLCEDGDWRTTAVTTPVTAYTVDDTVDSQRRRLLHRGA